MGQIPIPILDSKFVIELESNYRYVLKPNFGSESESDFESVLESGVGSFWGANLGPIPTPILAHLASGQAESRLRSLKKAAQARV